MTTIATGTRTVGPRTALPGSPEVSSLTGSDLAAVPDEVVTRLRTARRVMTVCHQNPDADALGSALAVALAVKQMGGAATPVCVDPVPQMYRFLPGLDGFLPAPEPEGEYDLIVVTDCGELARIGGLLEGHAELFSRVPIVNIDHHKSNAGFGTVDWIDADAAATCELVTLLVPRLGVALSAAGPSMPTNLMAGLVVDTANFQHSNVTARTLRSAAELTSAGAPLSEIARHLYRTKPTAQLRLFGIVLSRMQTSPDGRVVWSAILDQDLETVGASPAQSEGLVDLLGQSEDSEVTILFKQNGDGTRISVRTRDGGADATRIAGRFGGGGHARAAGATLDVSVEAAQPLVLEEVLDALRDAG